MLVAAAAAAGDGVRRRVVGTLSDDGTVKFALVGVEEGQEQEQEQQDQGQRQGQQLGECSGAPMLGDHAASAAAGDEQAGASPPSPQRECSGASLGAGPSPGQASKLGMLQQLCAQAGELQLLRRAAGQLREQCEEAQARQAAVSGLLERMAAAVLAAPRNACAPAAGADVAADASGDTSGAELAAAALAATQAAVQSALEQSRALLQGRGAAAAAAAAAIAADEHGNEGAEKVAQVCVRCGCVVGKRGMFERGWALGCIVDMVCAENVRGMCAERRVPQEVVQEDNECPPQPSPPFSCWYTPHNPVQELLQLRQLVAEQQDALGALAAELAAMRAEPGPSGRHGSGHQGASCADAADAAAEVVHLRQQLAGLQRQLRDQAQQASGLAAAEGEQEVEELRGELAAKTAALQALRSQLMQQHAMQGQLAGLRGELVAALQAQTCGAAAPAPGSGEPSAAAELCGGDGDGGGARGGWVAAEEHAALLGQLAALAEENEELAGVLDEVVALRGEGGSSSYAQREEVRWVSLGRGGCMAGGAGR